MLKVIVGQGFLPPKNRTPQKQKSKAEPSIKFSEVLRQEVIKSQR